MRAHHGYAAGLFSGLAITTNAPLLIGAGIAIGFILANVGMIARWIGRRYG